ncbi:1651_t:CDS:2, partial [Scutellospora calospora]
QTFDNLVKEYIESLAPKKKEKALIDQEKLQRIKKILIDPMNFTQYTSTFHYWVKIELLVLAIENMYDELCKIHATITLHSGQKEIWNQIDLIDMTFKHDNEFKYITHLCDHFTRYSWACALTSKRAIKVAAFLFKIFTIFGPPLILQLDNGKEFVVSVIVELLVFGRALYSHSTAFDQLFETSIFSKDEILNEFGLENIQELVNNLDDLINNTNFIPITTTESSSLNQDLNIETSREMESLGVKEFSELENILTDHISVREAAQNQNTSTLAGTIYK